MPVYILKDGEPVEETNLDDWTVWFADINNRLIKRTEMPGGLVKVIFIGINDLMYEVIGYSDKTEDEEIYQASTEEEALSIHNELVEKFR